ncbi:alpha-ketoglutarate-dependent dioxygenase AlkB [Pseudoxanthomonas sp. GM95]|uniref:alpha-ketoglutarate-dependent dioxygenase AlkB family protein n=1 Tax=Pseudoxanthomonas sp. GM95 TaxID=1881043 RepID=UPI0020C86693|nr:alpha-ketoglutarate-dependent dioxygenase AlkB [Pseudoxanthomonas sp. GM95]
MALFTDSIRICLRGADLHYHPAPDLGMSADALLARLRHEIPWQQHHVNIASKVIAQPRLSSWHGDVVHRYSTLAHDLHPAPWNQTLLVVREQVERITGARFNSVLANLYRDGNDAIGWHADDEPELGPAPVIASISLGAERRFDLRRRDDHAEVVHLPLAHGSMLVMSGSTQRFWQHAMMRCRLSKARINLTFRFTQPSRR